MVQVDLITGFLGSGKTTFIRKYAQYFIRQGKRVGILENDYGAVNVDMMLLGDLRNDQCELEMIAGGCDADCHARRFKTKLIAMAMSGYNRVIIEPSGIFDIEEFFDVLEEEPLDRWYEIGNVITILDARMDADLSQAQERFLVSQAAEAGSVVMSHTQLISEKECQQTKDRLQKMFDRARISDPLQGRFIDRPWDELTDADFKKISHSGYYRGACAGPGYSADDAFSSQYYMEKTFTRETIREKTALLLAGAQFGHILRIKGFFSEEGQWYEINATRRETVIKEVPAGQEVIIVIGEDLNSAAIDGVLNQ